MLSIESSVPFSFSILYNIVSKYILEEMKWLEANIPKVEFVMLRSHRDLSAQPRPESSDPTYAFWTWGVDVSRLKSESMVVHWLPVKFTGRRMGWTCSGVDTDPDLEE